MAQRRQVSIRINGKEVEKSFRGISAEARNIRRELNKMTIGSQEYNKTAKELEKANRLLAKHRDNIRTTRSSYDKMKAGLSNFVGIAAGAFAVDQLISFTGELFTLGTQMEVLGKKAETVFGESLTKVTKSAQENANAMGLTAGQYTDAATAIGDLLIPMKFTRDEAASISTNLVDLSGALSEWTGGQIAATEVADILGKAILGEREQLKGLGISISEADVQSRLAQKGLKNLSGEMLQQAKAAATLELITEKSADAQASFAANSNTLVRKQSELKAQFSEIKEAMATALIPVFHRLLTAATPVIKSFSDFIINLLNGQKATGKFSGMLNFLIVTLKNTGKFISFISQLFGKLFDFLLENGGGAIEFILVKFAQLRNIGAGLLNELAKLTSIDIKFEKVDVQAVRDSFREFKKARLESGVDDPIAPEVEKPISNNFNSPNNDFGPTKDGIDTKALEKAESSIEKLQNRVKELRQDFQSALLPEDDQAIAAIEKRYNKELEKALELSKSNNATIAAQALEQVMALEQLKSEAIAAEQERQFEAQLDKDIEQAEKILEEEKKRFEAKQALEQEIKAIIDEQTLSERELEIQQLEEHYQKILDAAQKLGIDTTELTKTHREQINQVNEEYNEKDVQQRAEAIKKEANIMRQSLSSLGSVIQGFQSIAEASGKRGAQFAKTLALVNIATKTAEAIAAGIAASAGQPFPANLAAIATTVATVLGNIASAKKILSEAPEVPQKKKGGFFNVRGIDDGQTYNAQYIGSPQSGMLPNRPVVLASEAGPEYFVSNKDLRNPVVLNYVRAIENIRTSRGIRQFQDGGFTQSPVQNNFTSSSPTPSNQNIDQERLSTVLERLANRLENPIFALIDDLTIADFQVRARELSEASGGAI